LITCGAVGWFGRSVGHRPGLSLYRYSPVRSSQLTLVPRKHCFYRNVASVTVGCFHYPNYTMIGARGLQVHSMPSPEDRLWESVAFLPGCVFSCRSWVFLLTGKGRTLVSSLAFWPEYHGTLRKLHSHAVYLVRQKMHKIGLICLVFLPRELIPACVGVSLGTRARLYFQKRF